ncbi:hypothetical protein Sste5344_006043 [Sporothrix stenoceras]
MAGVPGFSNNTFKTRSDLVRAAEALLLPVQKYSSPGGARVRFRPATAAHFDDVAAQLEGFARPLWAVAGLMKSGAGDELDLSLWIKGLESGTDPSHPEYWGNIGAHDQRMVEMESIAFFLLVAPDAVLSKLSTTAQRNLAAWLRQINDHEIPQNNWLWFRVFVNLALVRALGIPRSEVQSIIDDAFERLDSYKVEGPGSDGWSTDGAWTEFTKQADYYSGSFAIQFAQLLFVSIADESVEEEAKRAAHYREEAKAFSAQYWRYFDPDGAAIPFGRSLTYRFAMCAFWAAAAVSGVDLAEPVADLGTVKGLLFRHLRWWADRPDIFSQDGVVSIGFGYPNLYMSEEYNSPQSVYWCLKGFVALCLPENHSFWSVDEKPHPLDPATRSDSTSPSSIGVLWPPHHIISNTIAHHFLLSAGQMTHKPHKGREAKYGKFAYSSAFGFSVPTGQPMLQYIPPDSTLCLSIDNGESWIQRQEPVDVSLSTAHIRGPSGSDDTVSTLVSTWKPYPKLDFQIITTLVPLGDLFMGWHVRVHEVRWSSVALSNNPLIDDVLQIVEGGFAQPSLTEASLPLPQVVSPSVVEGILNTHKDSLMISSAGAVGIVNISDDKKEAGVAVKSQSSVLKAGPNTNLLYPKTSIPIVMNPTDVQSLL